MIRYFLAGIFSIALGLTAFAQGQSQKLVVDKILGAVGDRIILQSDVQNTILDAARNGDPLPEGAACSILEQSLISKILALQAERDSLPVTDDEVEANLDMRVRNWVMQFGSEQAVEDVAGRTIFQLKDDSRHMIKEQMLAQRMRQKIVENVHITPTEVKAFFDRVPSDSVPFLESELEIGQINIYPKAAKEVEEYIYNEMMGYRKQIEAGRMSFADAATKYTDDESAKSRGGAIEVNRNDKDQWDPIFLSTAFRLKVGEISLPVKSSKFGYFLITCESRRGDNAKLRYILRVPPVTQNELNVARLKLDSVRAEVVSGQISFKDAAYKYSEDEMVKSYGPFVLNQDGSTYVHIDQLPDKDMVKTLATLKVGDYSQPTAFTNEQGKQGVRILYLKSRTEPHKMNLNDDYNKIASMALETKKQKALDDWLTKKVPTFYVLVDQEAAAQCPNLEKYEATSSRGF